MPDIIMNQPTLISDYRPELDALDNNLNIFTDGLRFCAS